MPTNDDDKKILEKNSKKISAEAKIFDFSYHKLHKMLDELWKWDPSHPDVLVLNNILELYIDSDIDILWTEGYPLPYPSATEHSEINFSEDIYDLGIFDESLFDD